MSFTGAWSKGSHARYAYYFCMARCGAPSIPVGKVEDSLVEFLRKIAPKNECLELFISMLRRTYIDRLSRIKKRKEQADVELGKLYALRQSIIEKNLSGVYSDEVFKEQNALIEDKIITTRIAQDDTLISKYNLEEISKFIREFFNDLGKTYIDSNLTQKRLILSSIFDSRLAWSYPGFSNEQISPLYQAIRDFPNVKSPFGEPAGDRTQDQEIKSLLLYR